jgi:hypothetical protein
MACLYLIKHQPIMYNCTLSQMRSEIEVSGQLHVVAAFTHRDISALPITQEADGASTGNAVMST